jgi:hypothetical protein
MRSLSVCMPAWILSGAKCHSECPPSAFSEGSTCMLRGPVRSKSMMQVHSMRVPSDLHVVVSDLTALVE